MTCGHYGTEVCPYGLRPSPGVCSVCQWHTARTDELPPYDGPARGAGDLVAAATKAVGIRPCGGCRKRQEALNRILPRPG